MTKMISNKNLKQIIAEAIERGLKNWKSSMFAIIIFGSCYAVYSKRVTVEEWVLIVGGIATLYGLFKKDNDL